MLGNWSTAFRRFSDWRKADVFAKLFDACSDEPDMEYAMVDATIVKVHRHGQGAKGDSEPGHRPLQGRHLIENFFCKLKEFKRIAMRADQPTIASPP